MNPSGVTAAPRIVNRFFEFSLLGMLAAGYFAVLGSGFLDWPTAALTLVGLCVRALTVAGVIAFEPPPRVVAALAIAYMGFFPVDYYYISGTFLSATVHMVFFLAVLKLLTAKTPRDFGYLKAIAGLELIAAAILSEGLSFLAYLAVFVLFAIATFASGEVRRAAGAQVVVSRGGLKAFPRRLGVVSACLFGGILFMTVCLFFVLPRTARAAFERFAPARYRLTGFSNKVTLGEIGRIKQSSAAVMHVRSYQGEGFLPVKWRGAALAEFDGKTWFNPPGQEQVVQVDDGRGGGALGYGRRGARAESGLSGSPGAADRRHSFLRGHGGDDQDRRALSAVFARRRVSRGAAFWNSRVELQRVWILAERVGSGALHGATSAWEYCASC